MDSAAALTQDQRALLSDGYRPRPVERTAGTLAVGLTRAEVLEVCAVLLRAWRRGHSWLLPLGIAMAIVGLFAGYYRMALTVMTTADSAGNALQAFDLIHGNLLLHGWTVSDVSFYGVELFQFAAVEWVTGLNPQVSAASAALSYTLIVLLVVMLARTGATGTAAWVGGDSPELCAGAPAGTRPGDLAE